MLHECEFSDETSANSNNSIQAQLYYLADAHAVSKVHVPFCLESIATSLQFLYQHISDHTNMLFGNFASIMSGLLDGSNRVLGSWDMAWHPTWYLVEHLGYCKLVSS